MPSPSAGPAGRFGERPAPHVLDGLDEIGWTNGGQSRRARPTEGRGGLRSTDPDGVPSAPVTFGAYTARLVSGRGVVHRRRVIDGRRRVVDGRRRIDDGRPKENATPPAAAR